MKLYELYKVSPKTHIFVHQHTCKKFSENLHEFNGAATEAFREVLDVQAQVFPNYGPVLVVEIER